MANKVELKLFQTVEDKNHTCPFSFRSLDEARKVSGGDPDAKYYRYVYTEDMQDTRAVGDNDVLEQFYAKLNQDDRPGRTVFRSMSMSDVVALTRPGTPTAYYYCDTIGFVRIHFDPSRARL